jgi:ABC-type multidrug transport system permease subunit
MFAPPPIPPVPATAGERLRWTIADAWTVTVRDIIHWRRQPGQVVAGFAYSIMFIVLFGYVFGSSMSVPGGGDYREFMMPGLFVMTIAFGAGETMAAVSNDVIKGVHDRFRSMPMSSSAVVLGRATADLLYAVVGLAILMLCAWVAGWQWNGPASDALLGVGLLLLLRFALIWVGLYLGLLLPNPEALNAVWGLLFPITLLSNTFSAPESMPGWLGTIAEWNPLSATTTVLRDLFGNPVAAGTSWPAENAGLLAVAWPVAIVAVLAPLAVRRYRSLSR